MVTCMLSCEYRCAACGVYACQLHHCNGAQAVVASSCIMPGIPVWLQGNRSYCIDGGFSDFQILKVGCFCA